MVKGTNRRVIVVKSPDPRIFDEAIFVIKEDYMKRSGTMEQLLEEARRAAGDYLRRELAPRRVGTVKRRVPFLAVALAAAAGAAWFAMRYFGM